MNEGQLQLPMGMGSSDAVHQMNTPLSPESPLIQDNASIDDIHDLRFPDLPSPSGWELLIHAAKNAEPVPIPRNHGNGNQDQRDQDERRRLPPKKRRCADTTTTRPRDPPQSKSRVRGQLSLPVQQSSEESDSHHEASVDDDSDDPEAVIPSSSSESEMSAVSDSSNGWRKKRKRADRKKVKKSPLRSPSRPSSSSEQKVYRCEWVDCGKYFTTSGHLARHLRIHSGAKPYKCLVEDCESRFSRQDNMMQVCVILLSRSVVNENVILHGHTQQHYRTHIVKASGSFMHATQGASSSAKPFRLHVDTKLIGSSSSSSSGLSSSSKSHSQSTKTRPTTASPEKTRSSRPSTTSTSPGASSSSFSRRSSRRGHGEPTVVAAEPALQEDIQLFGEPKKAAAFWSAARSIAKPKPSSNRRQL
ncbi:transcriptional repressor [Phlyctochytrium planicorne]|nr:transcriptional repressor [Phlyctochytrium planicorne]